MGCAFIATVHCAFILFATSKLPNATDTFRCYKIAHSHRGEKPIKQREHSLHRERNQKKAGRQLQASALRTDGDETIAGDGKVIKSNTIRRYRTIIILLKTDENRRLIGDLVSGERYIQIKGEFLIA